MASSEVSWFQKRIIASKKTSAFLWGQQKLESTPWCHGKICNCTYQHLFEAPHDVSWWVHSLHDLPRRSQLASVGSHEAWEMCPEATSKWSLGWRDQNVPSKVMSFPLFTKFKTPTASKFSKSWEVWQLMAGCLGERLKPVRQAVYIRKWCETISKLSLSSTMPTIPKEDAQKMFQKIFQQTSSLKLLSLGASKAWIKSAFPLLAEAFSRVEASSYEVLEARIVQLVTHS